MSEPLVSIVIPNYNRAKVIIETLESVRNQSYENWECFVVDDGSTDDSLDVIRNFIKEDSRFSLIQRPNDMTKGANACRNLGLENSNGVYVQWFDSDDVMHAQKIEVKIREALKVNADVVIDQHQTEELTVEEVPYTVETFTDDKYYIFYAAGNRTLITNDIMLKKESVKDIRFDVNIHMGEEFEFLTRVFQQKLTYCYVNGAFSHYRLSPDSVSHGSIRRKSKSLILLSKKMIEAHKDIPEIVQRFRKQGRKTYKVSIMNRDLDIILKNFSFFRKVHNKGAIIFAFFLFYNFLTKKGLDRVK